MWMSDFHRLAIITHILNALQIIRLLATRGHYSIDIIVGWVIASHVSNQAGRLGRYYSRGDSLQEMIPSTATEVFEAMTGIHDARAERKMSSLIRHTDMQQMIRAVVQQNRQEDEEHQGLLETMETEMTRVLSAKHTD